MTFSLLDEEGRSWHLSSPFFWSVFTPDGCHYGSVALQGSAVSGTPEGPWVHPHPTLTSPSHLS